MRKLIYIASVISFIAFIIIALISAVIYVIKVENKNDEELLPQVKRSLNQLKPAPHTLKNNAFFMLAGFDAKPYDKSTDYPYLLGFQMLDTKVNGTKISEEDAIERMSSDELEALALSKTLRCNATVENCLKLALDNSKSIQEYVKANDFMIARLEAIAKESHMTNVFPAFAKDDYSFPHKHVFDTFHLYLMHIANTANDGQLAKALEMLETAQKLRVRIERSSDELASSILAIRLHTSQIKLTSDLLKNTKGWSNIALNRFAVILTQPAPSMARSLAKERDFLIQSFDDHGKKEITHTDLDWNLIKAGPNAWNNYIISSRYLHNASLNDLHQKFTLIVNMSRAPAQDFQTAVQDMRAEMQWQDLRRNNGIFNMRNTTGNVLNAIALPQYENYVRLQHSTEHSRRLVLLQLIAQRDRINAENIEGWINGLPADVTNPEPGIRLQYDEENGRISYEYIDMQMPENILQSIEILKPQKQT